MNIFKRFVKKVTGSVSTDNDIATPVTIFGGILGFLFAAFIISWLIDPTNVPELTESRDLLFMAAWIVVAGVGPYMALVMSLIVGKYVRWLTGGDLGNNPDKWFNFDQPESNLWRSTPYERIERARTRQNSAAVWTLFLTYVAALVAVTVYAPMVAILIGTIVGGSLLFKFTYALFKKLNTHVADPNAHNKGEK